MGAGMIEYWSAKGYGFPEEDVDFSTKMDTDLYALPKAKALPQSLELSSNGTQFAVWSSDRCPPIALWARAQLTSMTQSPLDSATQ